MWILRFQLLETKHYNKINRIYKKYGFSPRKISPIIFAKSSLMHYTQKKSWRLLAREFGVDHAALYRCDILARDAGVLGEIFHVFINARCALYIGNNSHVSVDDLNNSQALFDLTQREFENILRNM